MEIVLFIVFVCTLAACLIAIADRAGWIKIGCMLAAMCLVVVAGIWYSQLDFSCVTETSITTNRMVIRETPTYTCEVQFDVPVKIRTITRSRPHGVVANITYAVDLNGK
jgi:hypothetical protein